MFTFKKAIIILFIPILLFGSDLILLKFTDFRGETFENYVKKELALQVLIKKQPWIMASFTIFDDDIKFLNDEIKIVDYDIVKKFPNYIAEFYKIKKMKKYYCRRGLGSKKSWFIHIKKIERVTPPAK